jgi:predicted AlkP superfamily phosphohydrolase/phosphomutase
VVFLCFTQSGRSRRSGLQGGKPMRHVRNGIVPGLAVASYAGVLTALELAGANYIWQSPRNLVLLIGWSALLLAAVAVGTGLLVGLVSAGRRWESGKTVAFSIGAIVTALVFIDRFGMCYPCHQFLDLRNPHLVYTPIKSFAYTVGVGLMAVSLGAGSGIAAFMIRRSWRARPVRSVFYAALVGSVAIASIMSYTSTPTMAERRSEPRGEALPRSGGVDRLVLIVDEALTWEVIDPLLEKGSLPTFQSLMRNGVHGELASDSPTLSHTLFTTIATGRNPARHGIGSKIRYAYPGMTMGISTFPCPYRLMLPYVFTKLANNGIGRGIFLGVETRRVKALWNILSDAGVRVGVAGWRCTWPAEQVNGFVLSRQEIAGHPQDHCWPPAALAAVEQAMHASPEVTIGRLVAGNTAAIIEDGRVAGRLANARKGLEDDLKYSLAAKNLDAMFSPTFVALGLLSMDCVSHNFYLEHALRHRPDRFRMNPTLERYTSEAIVELTGGVIDSVYTVHDDLLREWIPDPTGSSALIIASDHGFEMNGSNHYYSAPGIIVLYGPPFRRGTSISGASIYDIAPTVLHVLGMPVPEDMEGEVLLDAFDPAWLEANPVRTQSTYER